MSGVASDAMIEAAAKAMETRLKGFTATIHNSGSIGWGVSTEELASIALTAALALLPSEAEIRADERAKIITELEAVKPFPSDDAYAKGVRTGMARAVAYLRPPRRWPFAAGSSSPGAQEQQG